MAETGLENPQQAAEMFIARFTDKYQLDPDLQPSLFVEIDPQTIALDLLSMNEFFDFCLRILTSRDDAPDKNSRRGALFEQAAWAYIESRLPPVR